MGSLSKSFNKAVKKARKSAKKAGNKVADSVKDATNQAGNAVAGAGEAASNALSREAQELGQEVDKLTRDVAKAAEQAYGEALAAGEAVYNEAMELAERFLSDALSEALEALAEDVYRKHFPLILRMSETGSALLKDPASRKDVERLADDSSHKRKDGDTQKSVSSLSKNESMRRTGEEARSKGLFTLSIGFGFGAARFGGGEGSVGYAFDVPEEKHLKGVFSVGAVAGYTSGASTTFQVGAWADPPSQLAGPYLAVSFDPGEKVFGAGVSSGVQVVFKMPTTEKEALDILQGKIDLAGLVVSLGSAVSFGNGVPVSACVGAGYTAVF